MFNRDMVTTPESSPAILAAIGITALRGGPLTHHRFVDRELVLSVSDGFSRQTWIRNGQVLRETRDTLALAEGEHVRITISNDMPGVRVISVGDGRLLRIRPGSSASIDLVAQAEDSFTIEVMGEPALARPAKVHAPRDARSRAA